jgi:hypothetical protein
MSLIRFRGAGNTTVPVSTQDPLPVAVVSGGGGGGGGPASDVTIVGVQSGVVFNTAIGSVASGVVIPIAISSVASGVTVPIAISSVASGVTVPVAGRMRMETVSQSATFPSENTSANITVSGQNLHDFGGCIIHYQLTNTYTVRLHGSFTSAQEMVVAEATDITGRGLIVLPTFHVPNLRVEFVRTSGTTSGQTNRVFIVLTPSMPV